MTNQPERPASLMWMCVLAIAVGTIGGLGAWLFRLLIGVLHNAFFLGELNFVYDANAHTESNPWGPGVILVPVIGAVCVAWLVKTFAPEAKGHGVPEVIDAIHYKQGIIRPIVAVIKSLASAICIGSGGSVGREGPIIQIGSAFGSTLGQAVGVPARQQITLVAAGAAAGIAATFNAPLGGVVFAIELLLVSINVRTLLPVALATVTATYLGRALLGVYPAFHFAALEVDRFELGSPW
ncbi:MAG: chloride channel protein, partial [Blastopirellula sp. JB062]